MNRLACIVSVVMLILLAFVLSGCSTPSGQVNGGGTIVGNPDIPYQPRSTDDEQLADEAGKATALYRFLQAGFLEQLDFFRLENFYRIFTKQPTNSPRVEIRE